MNNKKRKRLSKALEYLEQVESLLEQAEQIISVVSDEEQDSLDNMPESFADTDRFQNIEDAAGHLDDALESLYDVINSVQEAMA